MNTRTYKIPASHIEELRSSIEKLNRKSLKLTGSTITATISRETSTETLTYADTILKCMKTAKVDCFTVTITGDAPKLNGYQLMARIEYVEGKPVFHKLEDSELPTLFRTRGPGCDHCNHNRNRKHLFALKDGNQEWHQVGSTCLKDFTGANDPHRVAMFLQWLKDIREGFEGMGPGSHDFRFSLSEYMKMVCTVIRHSHGYMSRTRSREIAEQKDLYDPPTADVAWTLANGGSEYCKLEHFPQTDEDGLKASAAILWVNGELAGRDSLNDYEHNLTMVGEIGSVGWPETGIAASMIAAYERAIEQPANVAGFIGQEGQRDEFILTVSKLIPNVGMFEATLVSFTNEEGQAAVWFASNAPELETGKTYKVKATVKRHGNYRGTDQTTLTRCKVETAEAVSV